MARAKPPASVEDLLARLTGGVATRASFERVSILRLAHYPDPSLTTLVTDGLSAVTRTMFRGLEQGFELVASERANLEVIEQRLIAAVVQDLAAAASGSSHLKYNASPPRGIVYNGLYVAAAAPHLLFATELSRSPAFSGRHRVGQRLVEFLPAIPIDDAQVQVYDRSVPGLIASLRP